MIDSMKLWKHPKYGTWYIYFKRGKTRALKTKNKLEAQKLFREVQKEMMEGRLIELKNSELFSNFSKEYHRLITKTMTESYARSIGYTLAYFLDCTGDKELSRYTQRDFALFTQYLIDKQTNIKSKGKGKTYSKSSVNIHIRNIKRAFNVATEWRLIPNSPFTKTKQLTIDKKKPAHLKVKDIPTIINSIDDPVIKRAFYFYIYTGCRREEVVNLTWQDIDLDKKIIYIRKTKTHLERCVPINPDLLDIINDIPHKVGFLFPGKIKGRHIHKDSMTHIIKRILISNGFPNMRLHDLRHTFATLLHENKIPLKAIGELLGHTDSRTTQIYAHSPEEMLIAAVETLSFKSTHVCSLHVADKNNTNK